MRSDNHCCKYCIHATPVDMTNTCLCEKKGIVKQNGHCRKFAIDLLRIKGKRRRALDTSAFFPEDFSIE